MRQLEYNCSRDIRNFIEIHYPNVNFNDVTYHILLRTFY